jgi:hypothetical protein
MNAEPKPVRVVNVGALDLRKATKQSLPPGSKLVNVGMIIYDDDPGDLLAGVSMVNTGPVVKSPPEGQWETAVGPVVITRGMLEGRAEPLNLCAMGPLDIDPDVTVEEIGNHLGVLSAMGPVNCPEHLMSAVHPKIVNAMAPVSSYRCPPTAQYVRGKIVLDDNYLAGLADGTEFAVLGELQVPEVLDDDLIQKKLGQLYVTGRITCHAENLAAIQAVLADKTKSIKAIPAGFALVTKPLTLDDTTLASLPSSKLYCTRRVNIDPDVDASLLGEKLETLICEDLVLCAASLKQAVRDKGDWFKTKLVLYEGALWAVGGEQDLSEHHFEFLEGKATLVVDGELHIDQAVSPQTLSESLAKVHNLGVIWCTPEQMGALRPLLGLHDGDLLDATAVKEEAPQPEQEPDFAAKYVNAPYVVL